MLFIAVGGIHHQIYRPPKDCVFAAAAEALVFVVGSITKGVMVRDGERAEIGYILMAFASLGHIQ